MAKRKHRQIIETSLTLLAHSHVPTKYWLDAFNTTVFLINRIVLTHSSPQSPYEKLFCHSPDYSSLRVFGCACYPWLRLYVTNKLCLRSTKCIFIRYSPAHKGYCCLDPITGRVYVSRHVTFDENTFPLNECSSSRLPDQQIPQDSWYSGPLSRWLPSPHPSVNPQGILHIPKNILSSSTPLNHYAPTAHEPSLIQLPRVPPSIAFIQPAPAHPMPTHPQSALPNPTQALAKQAAQTHHSPTNLEHELPLGAPTDPQGQCSNSGVPLPRMTTRPSRSSHYNLYLLQSLSLFTVCFLVNRIQCC